MGSIELTKESYNAGGWLGKIDAPLNKVLQEVKWGEYKIKDLFDIKNTLSFNTDELVNGNEFDYVTRTSNNQGVLQTTGFVNSENINPSGTWSLGLLQMDFFYRRKPWYAGQFVRKIIPKFTVSERAAIFLTTLLNKLKPNLLSVLVRDVDETFLNSTIRIPITPKGDIDFEFISEFIAELESHRIVELENYISISGLKDCVLTESEQYAISKYNIEWKEYTIGNLFDRITTKKLPYKAADLPKQPTGENVLPCLTSSFMNQGLNYYVPTEGATILKEVISIPSNSDVYRAYYQSKDFTVLSDAYAIQWRDLNTPVTENHMLFMVMCINKVTDLPIYSYKNKLGGWNVVRNKKILLPVKSGKIDFEYMEKYITAIKKMVIKDVVEYVKGQ